MKKTTQEKVDYELQPKDARLNLRLSTKLLKAVKSSAKAMGIDSQKFVRLAVEAYLKVTKRK